MVAPGGACMVAPGGACMVDLGGMRGCSGGACVVAPGGACEVAPGGHVHGCSGGGHAWDTTRYGDTINERAVRILLECILVADCLTVKNCTQKEIYCSSDGSCGGGGEMLRVHVQVPNPIIVPVKTKSMIGVTQNLKGQLRMLLTFPIKHDLLHQSCDSGINKI